MRFGVVWGDGATVRAISALGIDLLESKLHPPPQRHGVVLRAALLDRIAAADQPVVSIMAPTGYGKTTLLAQWSQRAAPRAAWLTVDQRDNDPAVLLESVAAALDRVDPLPPAVVEAMEARRPVHAVMGRLLPWLADDRAPFTLAVDHADAVTNPEAFDILTQIALLLPERHRLLVASRHLPRWPAPRMRAHGRLFELGADDLSLDADEAADLLRRSGVELHMADIEALTVGTEGWAAGLYLAALAVQSGSGDRAPVAPKGSHPYLAEYFRAEVLDHLPPEEVTFLTRTSVLDRLGAPLCDAVLDADDSARWLRQIDQENLFLHPLDDGEEWYRLHQLFRDLLSAELRRSEPGLVPELHRRAAIWYQSNGMPEVALEHARQAGDAPRAVALIDQLMQPVWTSGRADTVMGWLQWLADEDLLALHPPLAVHGALLYALAGRPIDADRWADAVLGATPVEPLADGSSLEGLLAYLRAYLCRDGIERMRADAEAAYAGLSPGSPYRAGMRYVEGVAHRLDGRPDEAEGALAHALAMAVSFDARPQMALTLVERGGIAADRGDWTEAARTADDALALVGDGSYEEYWSSAVVFAWAARVAAHRGEVPTARDLLARASRLRPLLSYALPVTSVRTLVEMARASIAIGDLADAGTVMRQAREILRQRPGLGQLAAEVDAMEALPGGGTSLSAAELRIVPLLAGHLTLQEIADRLYLSRHTVKTHSIAIYRKLGVSSRREAVDRLQEMGLLVA
jgi:LuxR family maltose regulon positive regulatory protein